MDPDINDDDAVIIWTLILEINSTSEDCVMDKCYGQWIR